MAVPGEHHRLLYPGRLQGANRLPGLFLHHIRDQNAPGITSFHSHMNHGSRRDPLVLRVKSQLLHQLPIARGHLLPVHCGRHAISADLLHIPHTGRIHVPCKSLLQAPADGMSRIALGAGGKLHKSLVSPFKFRRRIHPRHLEHALGESARLVKDHILCLSQGLQVVGSLHQNPAGGGPADASEKA